MQEHQGTMTDKQPAGFYTDSLHTNVHSLRGVFFTRQRTGMKTQQEDSQEVCDAEQTVHCGKHLHMLEPNFMLGLLFFCYFLASSAVTHFFLSQGHKLKHWLTLRGRYIQLSYSFKHVPIFRVKPEKHDRDFTQITH